MTALYTDKVRDRFISPKHLGAIDGASGVGEVGNILCGDTVKMHVKLQDGKVKDAKYQTYGCVYSVACADMAAEMVLGVSTEQAGRLTADDVAKALGGLPETKVHCSVMAVNALRAALKSAGEKVELLNGARELTSDAKSLVKAPLSVREKHLTAELFDEFIIPEMSGLGIIVELISVSVESHAVEIHTSSSASFVKSFAEKILRKHVDESITVVCK